VQVLLVLVLVLLLLLLLLDCLMHQLRCLHLGQAW
jgi:hypothetical protein